MDYVSEAKRQVDEYRAMRIAELEAQTVIVDGRRRDLEADYLAVTGNSYSNPTLSFSPVLVRLDLMQPKPQSAANSIVAASAAPAVAAAPPTAAVPAPPVPTVKVEVPPVQPPQPARSISSSSSVSSTPASTVSVPATPTASTAPIQSPKSTKSASDRKRKTTSPEQKAPSTPAASSAPVPAPVFSASNQPASVPSESAVSSASESTKLIETLAKILSHRHAIDWFSEPVTDEIAEGYSAVVKHPMDLSTLKRLVDAGIVDSIVLLYQYLSLVFHNAYLYNEFKSDVHAAARELETYSHQVITQYFPGIADSLAIHIKQHLGPRKKQLKDSDSQQQLAAEAAAASAAEHSVTALQRLEAGVVSEEQSAPTQTPTTRTPLPKKGVPKKK